MKCHRLSLANRCLSHNAHLIFGMKSLWEYSNPYYKNLFSYLKMSMPWFEKVCFPRYTFSLFSWQCSSEAGRLYVSWVCRLNQLWINTNTSSESTRRRGLELFWFYLSLLLLFLKIKFLGGVAMFMVDSSYRNHSLRWKLLTRAINVKKLAIVYSTIPVWFGDRGGGGWGQRRAKSLPPHPYPFPYFWQATALLVQISFSPQPSADF